MPDTEERNLSTPVEVVYLKGSGVTGTRWERRKKKQFVFFGHLSLSAAATLSVSVRQARHRKMNLVICNRHLIYFRESEGKALRDFPLIRSLRSLRSGPIPR